MDTKFGRRTWDRSQFIIHKDDDSNASKDEHDNKLRELNDEQLMLLKKKYTNYDQIMRDSIKGLNQKTLRTNISQYKRGKQFGFYCDLCNLTFKDSLQYIDHLNSKIHQIKFKTIFDEDLISNKRDNDDISMQEFHDSYLREIKQFIKSHQIFSSSKDSKDSKNLKVNSKIKIGKVDKISTNDSQISKLMGFTRFESTKK